jgi:hypothetical protein
MAYFDGAPWRVGRTTGWSVVPSVMSRQDC